MFDWCMYVHCLINENGTGVTEDKNESSYFVLPEDKNQLGWSTRNYFLKTSKVEIPYRQVISVLYYLHP